MKKNHTCPRYTAGLAAVTATPARLAAPADREWADPAAGRLTSATALYTALWPRYTAGGGANGELGRRTRERELRTG
jgi:hypothetical protein